MNHRNLSLTLFLALAAVPSASWARTPQDLASGAPSYLGKQLPETSYVKFTAKRLTHAKVLWVNFDLLRKMGVDIPEQGLTADFEKQMLDAFAYAIPRDSDSPDAFSQDPNDQKVMYADRYGGNGMGNNFGSGRAASLGEVQIKGVGITPLVGKGEDFDHGHGGASIEESIREAVWGEVNQQELPYGSNRVLAVIDTGTSTVWKDGGKEPRALIVREDPLRPAHFVAAGYGSGPLKASEDERTKNAIDHLVDAVPADASAVTIQEKFETGFKNYVDRMADQYAAAYAKSLYHGATSVSNFELSGRYIDFGTETAQPGFAPIRILKDNDPAGMTEEVQAVLIDEFRKGLGKNGAKEITKLVPKISEMREEFNARYAESLEREFLALTGSPPELIEDVMKASGDAGANSAARFYEKMKKLIEAGSKPVNVDKEMPAQLGKYDLREILTRLAGDSNPTQESVESSLAASIPEASVRADFTKAYLAYYGELVGAATKAGLTAPSLATYIREASKIRNRKQVELYRTEMRSNNVRLIDTYEANGDRSPIWNEINNDIAAGARTYRDGGPFELVLKETQNLQQGYSLRNIYDARLNQEVMIYRVQLQNEQGYFYGHAIPSADLKKASIRYSLDKWGSSSEAAAIDRGDVVEFRIPVGPPDSNLAREVDLAMHSPDGQIWWKKDDFNIHLKVTPEDLNNSCVMSLQRSWWE